MTSASRIGFGLCFAVAVLGGCASASSAPAASSTTASAGAEEPQPSAAEPVSPGDLTGTWVEYWAVNGGADTEHYAFTAPDRFDWHAAEDAAAQTAVEKRGAFRLETDGKATFLVLEVQSEKFAACQTCAQTAGAREVQHESPLIERHELGECPSNPEAKQIDAGYTCRAIGGKAFWRKTTQATPAG